MSIFDRFKKKTVAEEVENETATQADGAEMVSEENPIQASADDNPDVNETSSVADASADVAEEPNQQLPGIVPAVVSVRNQLQQMQCEFREEDHTTSVCFFFDFQGGHFRIHADKVMNVIQIDYPLIFDTGVEYMNTVRTFCNEMNVRTRFSRFVYQYVEEKHRVVVHIFTGIFMPEDGNDKHQQFRSLLESHFALQRQFCTQLEEQLKNMAKDQPQDVELEGVHERRMQYLLAEQELMHQASDADVRSSMEKPITVAQVVGRFFREDAIFDEMRVVTDNLLIMSGNDSIRNYNILSALLEGEGENVQLKADEATLILKGKEESVTIQVTPKVEAGKAIYFHVSVLCPWQEIGGQLHESRMEARSFLMVYDKVSEENHEAEFKYMWEDAKAKLAAKNFKEMSKEQSMICDLEDNRLAMHFYWANKYFEEKRCFEALHHLEVVYSELNNNFNRLDDSLKNRFYHTCYMIGFCYTQLGMYQKAYFYLDIVSQFHRMPDTIEYVNCLANSKDFRAIYLINSLLADLQQPESRNDEEGEEERDSEKDRANEYMRNFLRRRKAYVLINLQEYEEAEKLLQELLKEPANADFALGELAYLQKLHNK